MISMEAYIKDCFNNYDMTHKKRGVAVIFNIEHFNAEALKNRGGSTKDVEAFQKALEKLGFDSDDIKVYPDRTAQKIFDMFKGFDVEYKYSDIDCFVCAILTHGGEEDMICGSEGKVKLYTLLSYLTPEHCPSLTGIPKLIFVQACRGSKIDPGKEEINEEGKIQKRPSGGNQRDPRIGEKRIIPEMPPMVDMLVFYSSFIDHPSFRHERDGSWFMQSLSEILIKYGDKYEIIILLTAVSKKVASFKYSNKDDPKFNGCKQMPCIMSTLRKALKFPPKN